MPYFCTTCFFLAAPPQDDPARPARPRLEEADRCLHHRRPARRPIPSRPIRPSIRARFPACCDARSALDLLRSRPVRAVEADAEKREQGLRHHRQRAARPRDHSAGHGRVAVREIRAHAPATRSWRSMDIELARLEFEQLVQLLTDARQQEAQLDVRRPGNARASSGSRLSRSWSMRPASTARSCSNPASATCASRVSKRPPASWSSQKIE